MTRRQHREPLMVRVWAELGAGRISERFIPGDKEDRFVHGECTAGHIVVNPVNATVDTIIHEILHRLYPAWSERYVRRTTTYLRTRMTEAETQAFFDEYEKRKRRRRAKVRD